MHAVDVALAFVVVFTLVVCIAILARQRYMLRADGAIPLAIRMRGDRWLYGIARYTGGELRWFRALGIGTRPTRVLQRADLRVLGRRPPQASELGSLPPSVVVVECRDASGNTVVMAMGESALTGFVSWLEASAPMS